jgi:hemerythrin superfamily protein
MTFAMSGDMEQGIKSLSGSSTAEAGASDGSTDRALSPLLRAEHRRLSALFAELLDCVHSGETSVIQPIWARFERGLLAHMAAEEREVLPLFEVEHPDEARAIRDEHARIREVLARMGVDLELHVAREESVQELVRALEEHAAREDAALYRWADKALPREQAGALRRMLATVVKEIESSVFTF